MRRTPSAPSAMSVEAPSAPLNLGPRVKAIATPLEAQGDDLLREMDEMSHEIAEITVNTVPAQPMTTKMLLGEVHRTGTQASQPSAGPSRPRLSSLRSKGENLSTRQRQLDILALQLLKRSLGQANSAAMSEAPDLHCNFDVRLSDAIMEVDLGETGSCGFSVLLPRSLVFPPGAGAAQCIGMCHHFTWDGRHCVAAGLGSEHANRCAGSLCISGAVPDSQVCRVVGAHAPTSCAKSDSENIEVVCGPPNSRRRGKVVSLCSVDSCPFLYEGKVCPFAKETPMRPQCTIHL